MKKYEDETTAALRDCVAALEAAGADGEPGDMPDPTLDRARRALIKDTTYNGWKNYETWCVKLWIDNEQSTQRYAHDMRDAVKEVSPICEQVKTGIWTVEHANLFTLADTLKAWVEEALIPDLGATLASDLLGAALSEVDWDEIAQAYLDDAEDN